MVDVDDGYGTEENVSRTIYEMESAGVAGIQIENQISRVGVALTVVMLALGWLILVVLPSPT